MQIHTTGPCPPRRCSREMSTFPAMSQRKLSHARVSDSKSSLWMASEACQAPQHARTHTTRKILPPPVRVFQDGGAPAARRTKIRHVTSSLLHAGGPHTRRDEYGVGIKRTPRELRIENSAPSAPARRLPRQPWINRRVQPTPRALPVFRRLHEFWVDSLEFIEIHRGDLKLLGTFGARQHEES